MNEIIKEYIHYNSYKIVVNKLQNIRIFKIHSHQMDE